MDQVLWMTLPVVGAITPDTLCFHDYVMAERLQDNDVFIGAF